MASTRQRNGRFSGLYRDAQGKQRSAGTFGTEREALKTAQLRENLCKADKAAYKADDLHNFMLNNDGSLSAPNIFALTLNDLKRAGLRFTCARPGCDIELRRFKKFCSPKCSVASRNAVWDALRMYKRRKQIQEETCNWLAILESSAHLNGFRKRIALVSANMSSSET